MTDAPFTSDDLQALLLLQEVDTTMDQLRHRREHLPAHGELQTVLEEAGALRPTLNERVGARDALVAQQTAIEAEVQAAEQRIATINARLYGSVPVGAKDAQSMSEEVQHLQQRRSGLEDQELEIMERLEPVEAAAAEVEAKVKELADRQRAAQAAVAAGQAEVDQELAALAPVRAERAAAVPAALQARYDGLRRTLDLVAVAKLVGGSCGGCHLALAPAEVERLRRAPEGQVLTCDECGRILVP